MSDANLISISHPSKYTGCSTAQELVAWCARVSNPSNQANHETSSKLIQYLLKHQHWSPLEMVSLSIEIRTTRDIARQILRHRSFSFQEFSQRYADPLKSLDFEIREARLQDKKNRQNSIDLTEEQQQISNDWYEYQQKVINVSKEAYKWAIENGVAKEQARSVLPEGNTESVVIMAGTLRSWVHYCQLRMKKDTQKEHREVAEQCWNIISHEFPDIKEAIDEIAAFEEFKRKF